MRNSPCGKHIGVLPAQHPPDCTNITAPPRLRRRSIAARAAGVAVIRVGWVIAVSEQAERFAAVADQQVLRLAVVVEHHPVVLPANAGDLVTAERRTRGVLVVAVRPDPAGFDTAAHLVGAGAVACPDPGAEAVEGVVGDLQRVRVVGEGGYGEDRAEDLLLEHPHLVVALEHGRLAVPASVWQPSTHPARNDQEDRPVPSPAAKSGSDEELEQLRGFPELAVRRLIRYFMLTADEMFVRKFRGQGNVLGATVQFCTPVVVGFVPDEAGWPAGAVGRRARRCPGRSPRWA